jgi:hypothetical protein
VWNRNAVAGLIPTSDLPNCPACVSDYYQAMYGGAAPIDPLAGYRNPACERAGEPPMWLYSSVTGKCYFKSSFLYGIAGSAAAAETRCQVSGRQGGAPGQLLGSQQASLGSILGVPASRFGAYRVSI